MSRPILAEDFGKDGAKQRVFPHLGIERDDNFVNQRSRKTCTGFMMIRS